MSGKGFAETFEDKAVVRTGIFADNLRIHQIAEADAAGGDGSGNGYIVDDTYKIHSRTFHIEPKGKDNACRSTMAGKTGIACKVPVTGGIETDGKEHFQRMCKEICGLIKQAMSQTCTHQYADKAIEEQRVELLLRDSLFLIETHDHIIGDGQADAPQQRIPAHRYGAYGKGDEIGVPDYHNQVRCQVYTLKRKCMISPSCTT